MTATVDWNEQDKLRDLFVGKSVVSVEDDVLALSDGTRIRAVGNHGCGGCYSGWYELETLSACENLITNVKVEIEGDVDDEATYRLYALTFHPVPIAEFKGSDGNGFYGTGFWLEILP